MEGLPKKKVVEPVEPQPRRGRRRGLFSPRDFDESERMRGFRRKKEKGDVDSDEQKTTKDSPTSKTAEPAKDKSRWILSATLRGYRRPP